MSISLSILASGSAGNCSVVRSPGGILLIDCGIGPRTAAARLRRLGVHISQIAAICLTHLDHDHFNPAWTATIIRHQIPIFCHESRAHDLADITGRSADFARQIHCFNGLPFDPLAGVSCSAIHLAHDRHGSHGFLLESAGCRLGYATDFGRVDSRLIRFFCPVDLLAIESNYDPQMQNDSPRPWFLKQRIMGGRGHLSNRDALAAVQQILDQAQLRGHTLPKHIILLHRSRQCNCPRLVRDLFRGDERISPRLVLAEQHESTPWLSASSRPVFAQLELQWT
jgi:phosphoribosyl 1,2-cyclic phosphodiesterase